jgi:hypothetical protein
VTGARSSDRLTCAPAGKLTRQARRVGVRRTGQTSPRRTTTMTTTKAWKTTIRFTAGTLEGLEYTDHRDYQSQVGRRVDHPIGGSPYVFTACDETTRPSNEDVADAE